MAEEVHDITANLPTMVDSTRSKVQRFASASIIAVGAFLLADDAVKSLRRRKKVKVVVEDNTEA